jgi:hypothetical protein
MNDRPHRLGRRVEDPAEQLWREVRHPLLLGELVQLLAHLEAERMELALQVLREEREHAADDVIPVAGRLPRPAVGLRLHPRVTERLQSTARRSRTRSSAIGRGHGTSVCRSSASERNVV